MNPKPTLSLCARMTSARAALQSLTALTLPLLTSSCGDAPYAMVQSHLVTTDPNPPTGYSCGRLDQSGESSSGEAGNGDGFWQKETQNSDGVQIVWGSGSRVLGSREFPSEFFEAHHMKRFAIEAPDGTRISYMVWGSDSCTPCPEQPYTALPGDISDCGQAGDAGAAATDDSRGNLDPTTEDEGKVGER